MQRATANYSVQKNPDNYRITATQMRYETHRASIQQQLAKCVSTPQLNA